MLHFFMLLLGSSMLFLGALWAVLYGYQSWALARHCRSIYGPDSKS